MYYHTPRRFWTRCQFCNQRVFYYENDNGSKVFFDDVGHPWPKHNCPERQAKLRTRKPSSQAGWLKVEHGRQIKSISSSHNRRRNRPAYGESPRAKRDKRQGGISKKIAQHGSTVSCQGAIAFMNETADIFKKANLQPGSIGASLLGRFAQEPLVQLTVHRRIHSQKRGQKLSFTFFLRRSITKKLNLKKGMQVAVQLRGVVATPSHPIWVCDQINC